MDQKLEKYYAENGDASHYNSERINVIVKFERLYGTLATMLFCEMTAMKYRERLGKKDNQTIEQEMTKIKWYEDAARFYFNRLNTPEEIIINNRRKFDHPWKETNEPEYKSPFIQP